jgi:hypothetical protein
MRGGFIPAIFSDTCTATFTRTFAANDLSCSMVTGRALREGIDNRRGCLFEQGRTSAGRSVKAAARVT